MTFEHLRKRGARPLDFMMSTGDNTDNHELVELAWFLDILNGGAVTASTGDPSRYEGVQDSGSAQFPIRFASR